MATHPYLCMDVTLRDGLQSATRIYTLDEKKEMATRLLATPLPYLEIGSLCNESRVPQMAGSEELFIHFRDQGFADRLFLFVPNEHGLERGFRAGLRNYSFLLSPDETFLQKNIRMTNYQSLVFLEKACKSPNVHRKKVYISSIQNDLEATFELVIFCMVHRVDHIFLSDTYGNLTPKYLRMLLTRIPRRLLQSAIGLHLHKGSQSQPWLCEQVDHRGRQPWLCEQVDHRGRQPWLSEQVDHRGRQVKKLIEVATTFGVLQYDISFLRGEGGCPFIPEEERHENLHITDLFPNDTSLDTSIQDAISAFPTNAT